MPRRFRYGYNGQWNTATYIGAVTPIGYMETVPGDTWSGSSTVHFWSDTTKAPWTNKMFSDVFAFYVPFRLLWNGFPDLVRNDPDNAAGNVPVCNAVFDFNYQSTLGSATNVFQTRAYNLICEKFFDESNDADSNPSTNMGDALSIYDATAIRYARYRPSTFHESVRSSVDMLAPETFPVNGAAFGALNVNVDDVRDALAKDNFNKLRNYYGSRYVDYLNALGVKGQWTMQDEPELIGKVHHTLPLEVTNATTEAGAGPDQFVGTPKGQWKGQVKLSLKKTFTPEHGLICFMAVNRLDTPYFGYRPVCGFGSTREDFWSPEYQTGKDRSFPNGMFSGAPNDAGGWYAPEFEHLRKGENVGAFSGSLPRYYFFQRNIQTVDAEELGSVNSVLLWANLNDIFDGDFAAAPSGSAAAHFNITTDHRLIKYSPVKPNNFREPLR